MKRKILGFIVVFLCIQFKATIKLPYQFSDDMVLQRNKPIKIWGNSDANEMISVTFNGQKIATKSDTNGHWKVVLPKMNAGGPYDLKVIDSKGSSIVLKNIAIGEVWLASGQSNMEWALRDSDRYQQEINKTTFPDVRELKIHKNVNSIPQQNLEKTSWRVANKENIGDFSAVAYHFGKRLNIEKGVTVGIINSSWGGTVIESWIPREGFENSNYFEEMISQVPQLNWEDLKQLNYKNKTNIFQSKLKTKIGELKSEDLLSNHYDDSLDEINVPGIWENQGFESLDGVVLLKKTIHLSKDQVNADATLFLGKIDDQDITYFNGIKVGENQNYDAERTYTISKEWLKVGENSIVIRVKDTGSGGGLWSNPENVRLQTNGQNIPLAVKWKFVIEEIQTDINKNEFHSLIYNAMIHPIKDQNIEGIIWYQGESNESRAFEYKTSFPLLIDSWRKIFGKEIPFYYVQLSTFETSGRNSNEGSPWAELREAQTNALQLSNTGMVVTTDIGNPTDIHPRNKYEVGERLSMLALNKGKSPIYQSSKITKKGILIKLSSNEKLIVDGNKSKINGFEIKDGNGQFHIAEAKIVGKSKILVFNKNIEKLVSVRYGWKGDNSDLNLKTEQKLPISPFRTDHDRLTTEDVRYQPIKIIQ